MEKKRKGNVSLLHLAVSNNNIELIDMFLEKSLDINLSSDDLGTPLNWAIAYGQANAAKHLISKGAVISAESTNSNVPPGIHLAISSNNMEIANFLLDKEEKCYHVKDHEGWSTLHCAAEIGDLDLCQKIAKKVDPNYKC